MHSFVRPVTPLRVSCQRKMCIRDSSQLVRRLRDKGWVEQVRNAANNRQVRLRLTPAGEHVYRDHAAFDKQCQALTFRRLEGFTEAELAAYLSIQRRINEAYADDVRRSREYFT